MTSLAALRPILEDDLPTLERFLIDPEEVGPFEWHGFADPGRWRKRWAVNGLLDDDGGQLLVVSDRDVLGFVAWRKIITARGSFCWNIGIALLAEHRGKGHGTTAQRLLVQYLFAHTQVARIEAGTNVANFAEQRALEKVGFTREGVMRSHAFGGGRWHDTVLYSILRDEAEARYP
ncbi:GNAT family protein [Catenulispora subtropica]|uniref:GNAT family protein n=1 Tax=Catenulispora subtropica TaxID=450798 RepID=A0ABP5DG41_9ACTN